jgi:BirA family transcriptional regulator, biotin operon repressor / biotin---[acetyl-CoA-carboxylase] ligase
MPPSFHLQRHDRLPSTNAYAQKLLSQGVPDRTVVWAMDQFAGRGQTGNSWLSEPGSNLTFSLILYPELPATEMFLMSKVAALALHGCVSELLPQAQVLIKWPNDLLVNGRKAAGILIENQLQGGRISSSILGLGLNVNQQVFPPELAARGSSLSREAGHSFALERVLARLLDYFDRCLARLATYQWAWLDRHYLDRLFGYQETVWVEENGHLSQRELIGVEKTGRLALAQTGKVTYYDIKAVRLLLPGEERSSSQRDI